MTNTVPSQTPGAPRAAKSQAGSAPGMPSAEPPAKASAHADCGCGGASVAMAPTGLPAATAGGTAPSAAPGVRGRRRGGGDLAEATLPACAGLWSINEDRNCWIYIDTVGWRKLSTTSESGLVALNMLAANAYQQNAVASCLRGRRRADQPGLRLVAKADGGAGPGRHRRGRRRCPRPTS